MSPHQRLILQESWKSLEDAGYDIKRLADTQVGVFIGAEPCGYAYRSFTGASEAIIASRLSYLFNLKGPAMVVNTACSSAGVAIHLACESLRHGESALALAGGVFATLAQSTLDGLADIGMLAPDGRCQPFDASASGTVVSEGVGRRRPETACGCCGRRRCHLRRDLWLWREPGWCQQRDYRPQWTGSGRADQLRLPTLRHRSHTDQLHRGPWNRHQAGRSRRGQCPGPRLPPLYRSATLLRRGQCQSPYRPYSRQRRGDRPDQNPLVDETPPPSWPAALQGAQPRHCVRGLGLLRQSASPSTGARATADR